MSDSAEELKKIGEDVADLKGRMGIVEVELNFSKRELQEIRDLYKHLEVIIRDSDNMVQRMNTLLSVQEEVIQQIKTSSENRVNEDSEKFKELTNRVGDLDGFKYKSIGITIGAVSIIQLLAAAVALAVFL